MKFTENQINFMLEVLVCSEDAKDWKKEWDDAHQKWHEWIAPHNFAQLSIEEFEQRFLEYYNEAAGRYTPLPLYKKTLESNIVNIKETMRFLLNESIPIKERIDEILHKNGKYKITGLAKGNITSILMDLNPEIYATWNSTTDEGLDVLGLSPEIEDIEDWGNNYQKIMDSLRVIKNIKPELRYLEIDHFLYIIAFTEEGKLLIQNILEGKIDVSQTPYSQSVKRFNDLDKISSTTKDSTQNQFLNRYLLDKKVPSLSNDEFAGRINYIIQKEIYYERTHGLIVKELKKQLKEKGLMVERTQKMDLYIERDNKITDVFEIKTDIDSSSLQKGVGQLVLYTLDIDEKPALFLVLPENLDSSLEKKLFNELNINIFVYKKQKDIISFPKLEDLIKKS